MNVNMNNEQLNDKIIYNNIRKLSIFYVILNDYDYIILDNFKNLIKEDLIKNYFSEKEMINYEIIYTKLIENFIINNKEYLNKTRQSYLTEELEYKKYIDKIILHCDNYFRLEKIKQILL